MHTVAALKPPSTGQVQEVLARGPVPDPRPTLEEARADPARLERIRELENVIDTDRERERYLDALP